MPLPHSIIEALKGTGWYTITGHVRTHTIHGRVTGLGGGKHILQLSREKERVPVGTFICTKCEQQHDIGESYALRLMPYGDVILHGGLVCPECADSCPLPFHGGQGGVRCARFAEDLRDDDDTPLLCSTTSEELVQTIRDFVPMEGWRPDISEFTSEIHARFRARRVRRAWQKLVARRAMERKVACMTVCCSKVHGIRIGPDIMAHIVSLR